MGLSPEELERRRREGQDLAEERAEADRQDAPMVAELWDESRAPRRRCRCARRA